MTADHVGYMIFRDVAVLRIIGRIAMPIFAFMIAEGCYYTRNKLKYFALIFGLGLICVAGYYVGDSVFYLNILITFSFSVAIIFALRFAFKIKKAWAFCLPALAVIVSAFFNYVLPYITGNPSWETDYGFFGTLMPVMIYVVKDFRLKLIAAAIGILAVALTSSFELQWWAFMSLPFLIFYDGTRGKLNLKYLFYIYYPLHLVAIYGISLLL